MARIYDDLAPKSKTIQILSVSYRPIEMESIMKKRMWISILLVVLAFIAVIWVFRSYIVQPSEAGFRLISLKDNTLLISD
jgi:hypothetical protein